MAYKSITEERPKLQTKCSEKTLEASLTKSVKRLHGICLKLYGNMYAGMPDRLVLMPNGLSYFVELKSEGIAPRKLQLIRHEELRKLGYRVYVIDTTNKLTTFLELIEDEQRQFA